MLKSTFIFSSILLVIASCKQQPEKPLTKAEVTEFARKIEISIDKRDPTLLNDAIDGDALADKMNLESGRDSRSFEQGLKEGMKMGSKIVAALSEKGTYTMIKEYEKDKVHHLLFRLYDNGMINYHDYELTRTKGKPKVADIYIYMSGETLSETLRNLYVQFKDDFKASSTRTDDWTRKVTYIRSMITSNKHRDALDTYNEMPEKIKKGRLFQILHIEICSGLSDEEYSKAIDEYEALYPNEPNMQLLLIDGYTLRKDYQKALNAVNELDKMIDKDPLLDYHRAMCYTLLNDDQKRLECLERLVKNVPEIEEGIIELIYDYLETSEFEKAKPLIDRYKTKSAFNQESLQTVLERFPGYGEKYGND